MVFEEYLFKTKSWTVNFSILKIIGRAGVGLDNIDLKEKVYYVDNTPFFLHNYKSEPLQMPSITEREYKITSNLGNYAYL